MGKQRNRVSDAMEAGNLRGKINAGKATDTADANHAKALALTEGRGDATMNDPRITAALDMIQKQMGEGPYTASVINQQANRMADRTATAAGQTAQSLRDQMTARGGNPNDPSFQAALRAADSGRMQQNNADRGDIESNATLSNYSAQNAAANQLANQRMSQLGQANGQYNQAAQLYANEQFNGGHVNSVGGGQQGNGNGQGSQSLGYTPPNFQQFTPNFDSNDQSGQSKQPDYGVPGQTGFTAGAPVTYTPATPYGTGNVQGPASPTNPKRPPGYTNLLTGQHVYNGGPDPYNPAPRPPSNNTQYDNAGDPSKPLNPYYFRPNFK